VHPQWSGPILFKRVGRKYPPPPQNIHDAECIPRIFRWCWRLPSPSPLFCRVLKFIPCHPLALILSSRPRISIHRSSKTSVVSSRHSSPTRPSPIPSPDSQKRKSTRPAASLSRLPVQTPSTQFTVCNPLQLCTITLCGVNLNCPRRATLEKEANESINRTSPPEAALAPCQVPCQDFE
jgi:hypothetical protein